MIQWLASTCHAELVSASFLMILDPEINSG
jgi:hypothetical protein